MPNRESVVFELNGNEVEAELTFHYTPYEPGRYYGPPEFCYPAIQEEWELERLTITEGEEVIDCTWIISVIEQDLIEQLVDKRNEAMEP